ncbi:GAF domain-containing protein [Candidatus Binatia bacterium]|jgi:signal transduction histidine kinase|nr:GAF domain-containing protein [Candidatus Binatia bacterium]
MSSLDLDGLVRAILTCVTAGPGLGFNRAALFLADEHDDHLVATMAIGPASAEEAHATWTRLATPPRTLEELLQMPLPDQKSEFQRALEGLAVPLRAGDGADPLLASFRERRIVKITNGALNDLPERLREVFDGSEVVCVPLVAKDRSLGLIVADNAFTREPIDDQRIQLLELLAQLAGLALDNARMYRQVERQATELAHAMDDLHAAQDKVIHSERLATVGAVVARVSHEIRNPLATIGGFARTLSAQPGEAERVQRNADIIIAEVTKLETLLKEMLDFTSPKAPHFEALDLNAAVAQFAELHTGALREHGIELTLELGTPAPIVLADPHQLQRVLLNLWQNAVQAIEERRDRGGTIRIGTRRAPARVELRVADDGIGIRDGDLAHLFTPFFTTKQRGTGLGLAVVKKIVDDHRGSIDVESRRGTGTTVCIGLVPGG